MWGGLRQEPYVNKAWIFLETSKRLARVLAGIRRAVKAVVARPQVERRRVSLGT